MANGNGNQKWTSIILIVAIIGFVLLGFEILRSSNTMYEQSVQQANLWNGKLLDSSFKKQFPIVPPSYATIRDGYNQAMSFFMLAFGGLLLLLLLPRMQNISIGPGGVSMTLKDLQQTVNTLIAQTNSIQAASTGEGGKTKIADVPKEYLSEKVDHPDDPQKGKWGGKSENNMRKLSAKVSESIIPGLFVVRIMVESTSAKFPLEGLVKFHLHNTFLNPDPVIVARENKAVLKLSKVWGAFTVGVETDDGTTKLELDLAELEDAPMKFRER